MCNVNMVDNSSGSELMILAISNLSSHGCYMVK